MVKCYINDYRNFQHRMAEKGRAGEWPDIWESGRQAASLSDAPDCMGQGQGSYLQGLLTYLFTPNKLNP